MNPAKVLVIRGEHGHFPERFSGFNCQYTDGIPSHEDLDKFLRDIDVVFSIESFYNWGTIPMARERGIKTVLRINYELNILQTEAAYPHPDLFVVPSLWNWDRFPFGNSVVLTFPVARDRLPFTKRSKVNRFYHIAGHSAYEDRNGTEILLAALPFIEAPVDIFSQSLTGPNIVHRDVANYWEIHQGDCCILPRRYGGQCLPMNEALSLGVPVLMPDIAPQHDFLPRAMLFNPGTCRQVPTQGGIIDCFDANPRDLANAINRMYNADTTTLSEWANTFAENMSWNTLLPDWIKLFEEVCCV